MNMTDKNEWWLKKFNEKNWGACFECCDYEGMVDDIRGILAEHTRRIVEVIEGMRKPIPSEVNMTPFPDDLIAAFRVEDQGFNKALDEVIRIVNTEI